MSKHPVSSNKVKIIDEMKEADKYTAYLKRQNEPFIKDMERSLSDSLEPRKATGISSSIASKADLGTTDNNIANSGKSKKSSAHQIIPFQHEFSLFSPPDSSAASSHISSNGNVSMADASSVVPSRAMQSGSHIAKRMDRHMKSAARHTAFHHLRKYDTTRTYQHAADITYRRENEPRYWKAHRDKASHIVSICMCTSLFTAILDILVFLNTMGKGQAVSSLEQELMLWILICSCIVVFSCVLIGWHYNEDVHHDKYMEYYTARRKR